MKTLFAKIMGKVSLVQMISGMFIFLAVILSLLGWMCVSFLEEGKNNLRNVYLNDFVPTSTLQQLNAPVRDIGFRMAAFLASQMPAAGCRAKLEDASSTLHATWKKYQEQAGANRGSDELVGAIDKGLTQFDGFKTKLNEAYTKSGNEEVGKLFENDWPDVQSGLLSPIQKLVAAKEAEVGASYDRVNERTKISKLKAFSAIGMAVLLLAASFFLVRKIAFSLRKFGTDAVVLDHEANSLIELSSQFLKAAGTLSEGGTQQNSAFQQTTAAVAEIDASIKMNAESMQKTALVAESCEEMTRVGSESVKHMVESVDSIASGNSKILEQVEESNRRISDIVTVIEAIGDKTKVINDIVFQTKLLSFNASVEAARAGEHGRGFSVVAEEVGNLAKMSGGAAGEISAMLQGSIEKVRAIVGDSGRQIRSLVVESQADIDRGKRVAAECDESLVEIRHRVEEMSKTVKSVASATLEQSKAVSEVSTAVHEADKVTRKNSIEAEKIEREARHLSEKSEVMAKIVRDLNSVVKGQNQNQNQEDAA